MKPRCHRATAGLVLLLLVVAMIGCENEKNNDPRVITNEPDQPVILDDPGPLTVGVDRNSELIVVRNLWCDGTDEEIRWPRFGVDGIMVETEYTVCPEIHTLEIRNMDWSGEDAPGKRSLDGFSLRVDGGERLLVGTAAIVEEEEEPATNVVVVIPTTTCIAGDWTWNGAAVVFYADGSWLGECQPGSPPECDGAGGTFSVDNDRVTIVNTRPGNLWSQVGDVINACNTIVLDSGDGPIIRAP